MSLIFDKIKRNYESLYEGSLMIFCDDFNHNDKIANKKIVTPKRA